MKFPKTVKGYIKLLKQLEKQSPTILKGFEKLSESEQKELRCFDAELSNIINVDCFDNY